MDKKERNAKLGPTGKHPKGKLNEHDSGQLVYAVGLVDDKIIIDFNTPVTWIGLDIESATSLNNALSGHIETLLSEQIKTLRKTIQNGD